MVLSAWRFAAHRFGGHALLEAGAEAGQRAADRGQPGGDVPPPLLGGGVHDREGLAQLREHALEVAEVALVVEVLDRLERVLDVLAHHPDRERGPPVLGRRQRVERGPLLAEEGGHRGHPGR